MPRKKPRRLPKRYARPVSRDTKRFVKRTMGRKRKRSKERFRRLKRRFEVMFTSMRASAVKWSLALAIFAGLMVLGFLLFSPIIQVREIQVTRESPRLDIEDVQQALAPMFGKHLFFLSSYEVAALLQKNFLDIESITVQKTYPSTLHVGIELHPLVARLRILEPDEQNALSFTGSTVDFLTEEGVYIATTAAKDPETLPEVTIVDWGVRPDPKTELLDPAVMERMNAAEITLLRQFGQEVTERRVFLRANEFHLHIGSVELWFDMQSPLEMQLNRYRVFLREVSLDEVRQYIDLRISDRVVYQ